MTYAMDGRRGVLRTPDVRKERSGMVLADVGYPILAHSRGIAGPPTWRRDAKKWVCFASFMFFRRAGVSLFTGPRLLCDGSKQAYAGPPMCIEVWSVGRVGRARAVRRPEGTRRPPGCAGIAGWWMVRRPAED